MAEQEKNQKLYLSKEQMLRAIQRMKENVSHTDSDGPEIFNGEIARELDVIMKPEKGKNTEF